METGANLATMNQRIVSLIASGTEIVCALGFEDQLVGRSHECDYPSSIERLPVCSSSKVDVVAHSSEIDSQVRSIVADGLSVYDVDPRILNRLAPTTIVTQSQCEVCAVSLHDVERAVCELVGSEPRVVSLEPMCLLDVWKDIRKVASVLGNPERGDELAARLSGRLQTIHAGPQTSESRPSIACIEWIDPLMVAGNWVPDLVDCAGGTDVLGRSGEHADWIEIEQLLEADPDVIAIMPCGFDIERASREMAPLAEHPEWERLSAVRKGRVVITDGNQYFNRPGPRVVESAEILSEVLYPERAEFGHRGTGWINWKESEP